MRSAHPPWPLPFREGDNTAQHARPNSPPCKGGAGGWVRPTGGRFLHSPIIHEPSRALLSARTRALNALSRPASASRTSALVATRGDFAGFAAAPPVRPYFFGLAP